MHNISFRAKDASEAGKRLEEALNGTEAKAVGRDRLGQLAEAMGALFSIMPEGRQVAVTLSLSTGEEEGGDGNERVRVKVATVTDRESGALAQRHGQAEGGDASIELSAGDDAHARRVASAEQDERDRAARAAQSQADALRNKPAEAGVRPGDNVSTGG